MDKSFLDMLKILSLVCQNKKVDASDYEAEKILAFSKQQGVNTIILSALKEQNQKYNALFLKRCLTNSAVNEKIALFLNNTLEGIPYAFLKGQTIAELYPYPEMRDSSDTDILINEEDEEKVLGLLRNNGFTVENRASSGNHSVCFRQDLGVLEVHVALFYPIINDKWFGGYGAVKEEFINVNGLPRLGITDGFMFLFLHGLKHFLAEVFLAKNLMDILLYIKKYKNDINWDYVIPILKELRYKAFLDVILTIAIRYLDFKKEEFCDFQISNFAEAVLDDIQKRGILGIGQFTGDNMFEQYNEKRLISSNGEDLKKTMTQYRRRNSFKTASFSKKNMLLRYSFIKEKPYLLPLAWVKHIVFIIKTVIARPDLVRDSISYKTKKNDNVNKRLELIKKMGMI